MFFFQQCDNALASYSKPKTDLSRDSRTGHCYHPARIAIPKRGYDRAYWLLFVRALVGERPLLAIPQSGAMPLSVSSLIAFSFFDRCASPMPRSTFGALAVALVVLALAIAAGFGVAKI